METGTHLGDTVAFLRPDVDRIWSIEVDPALQERAQDRFRHDEAITILLGDSGRLLPDVVAGLDAPALFWLDGHWSGQGTGRADRDTPVLDELRTVLADVRFAHVVLVDDANLFVGGEYPTVAEVEDLVHRTAAMPRRVRVADNIISIIAL